MSTSRAIRRPFNFSDESAKVIADAAEAVVNVRATQGIPSGPNRAQRRSKARRDKREARKVVRRIKERVAR